MIRLSPELVAKLERRGAIERIAAVLAEDAPLENAEDFEMAATAIVDRGLSDLRSASESTVASLRAEVERLTKALEPFATAHRAVRAAARSIGKVLDDEDAMQSGFAWRDKDGNRETVTWGDLRTAARALDRSPGVESGNG